MARPRRTGVLIATFWLALSPAGWATASPAGLAGAAAKAQAAPVPCAVEAPASLGQAFRAPPRSARPRIRYWTPQAAIADGALRGDVDAISAQGFGEVELVAMDRPKTVSADYAWGTDRWDHLVAVLANEAARKGLAVSLTNGPAWPIAMPAVKSADDPASLYELTYGVTRVAPGQTYDGPLAARRVSHPEGTPNLIAVLAYRVTRDKTLDAASVIDLTRHVHATSAADPRPAMTFAPPPGGGAWMLFSFWEQPADQKTAGLYVIDHLGADGARASADYWRAALAKPAPGQACLAAIFNDSMEYKVSMEWTRGMLAAFRARNGYDLTPFLPFIGWAATYPPNDIPGFRTSDPEVGRRANDDYLTLLTALYRANHLRPLQRMAEQHGTTIQYQVGYNKPYEIETVALDIGKPETEALGRAALDGMRQMAAAAHLTGKSLSIEDAAEFFNNYGQSTKDILWWTKRAWASGVSMETLHGGAYSGRFEGPGAVGGYLPGVTWPGWTTFYGQVSNDWNRPAATPDLRRTIDYVARVNFLLQKPARVDVAIYRHALDVFVDPNAGHGDGNALCKDRGVLNDSGYSYDFVTPALLALPQSIVHGHRLAPDGPAYKALVIADQPTMSLATLKRIDALARAGLPVVFAGATPERGESRAAQLRGETDTQIRDAVSVLLARQGVARVATIAEAPAALRKLGIRPDADPSAPAGILAQHRADRQGNFYYLYNYNKVSDADAVRTVSKAHDDHTTYPNIDVRRDFVAKSVRLSLAGRGRPYVFDAWSGAIRPVAHYERADGRVAVDLRFAGDEAKLIGLLTDAQAAAAGVRRSAPAHAGLRNGKAAAAAARTIEIADWTLTVDALEPGASGSPDVQASSHRRLGPFQLGAELKPWRSIDPSLTRASGTGVYAASFVLEPSSTSTQTILHLGDVEDTYDLDVNGREIAGIDPTSGVVDVTGFVHPGRNTLSVRVATTLFNAVNGGGKDYGVLGVGGRAYVEVGVQNSAGAERRSSDRQ